MCFSVSACSYFIRSTVILIGDYLLLLVQIVTLGTRKSQNVNVLTRAKERVFLNIFVIIYILTP